MPRTVTYTMNNKPVSGRKFVFLGIPLMLLALSVMVVWPVALWTNNTVLVVAIMAIISLRNIHKIAKGLKGKGKPSTNYDFVNLLGFIVFSFAMWHHNPLFIIIGLLLMVIKPTYRR